MELLMKESKKKLTRVAPGKVKAISRISDSIERHEDGFNRSVIELRACQTYIHDSMRLTKRFSMATLDQLTMFVLIVHMFLFTLNNSLSGNQMYWVLGGFAAYYSIEMCARLKAARSFGRFCNDPRGPNHSFRNVTALALWIVTTCFVVLLWVAAEEDQRKFCHVCISLAPCQAIANL